ncbi:formyltetrahydrofolate deformylase [Trinickia sp. LjRoot230]
MDALSRPFTLKLSGPDKIGIAATIGEFLARHHCEIVASICYIDRGRKRFFARYEVVPDAPLGRVESFRDHFAPVARDFGMEWSITDQARKKRVVILVSRVLHCLNELLDQWNTGRLAVNIGCVISNHEVGRQRVEQHGIPFHYVPTHQERKEKTNERLLRLFDDARAEVLVLARYMQVLPAEICNAYAGGILNVHHSLLPSFPGAKPYHQAFARGVKLIGATCHYVTSELDDGPIIDQDVVRINHADQLDDFIRLGQGVERNVLLRGLRYHLEDRVLIHDRQTVVLS